jgi:NosR/NirI family nitrous oxide reductase transcriptional regulator
VTYRRPAITVVTVLLATGPLLFGQGRGGDAQLQLRLKGLFPAASAFSAKEGDPPHYTAYTTDAAGAKAVLGYAYWTTDLDPLERGYDGPIVMLVGMDLKGMLTGLVVVEDHEPYGNFSVETPAFAAQFKGKDVRDAFKVGADIDAVSRATISVTSASRAVRNASRRLARALLTPPSGK